MDTDRTAFSERIASRREAGIAAVLAEGIRVDDALRTEMITPGSDERCGVNIVARPNGITLKVIREIQERLRSVEPSQYYYPSSDLHLTYLEVCHSRGQREVDEVAPQVVDACDVIARATPKALLTLPKLVMDPGGCALNFVPGNDSLQRGRERLRNGIARRGIAIDARYVALSAHVTFMRYIAPLAEPTRTWVGMLEQIEVEDDIEWDVDDVWVTWGANWYGMASRIAVAGPHRLEGGAVGSAPSPL